MVTIYAIYNRHTKDRYIGSTEQKPESRWSAHKRLLQKGDHHSRRLQEDWFRWGASAFVFGIVRTVTKKERLWAEQKEIDSWVGEAGRERLYNENTQVYSVRSGARPGAAMRR